MALFLAQVLFGVLAGSSTSGRILSELLPFNIVRMIHINALIVWLLLGFFGATYYLMPEEAERDIHSPMLAYVQFWIFVRRRGGPRRRLSLPHPRGPRVPRAADLRQDRAGHRRPDLPLQHQHDGAARAAGRRSPACCCSGLWGAAVFFLFAFYNPGNLVLDKIYWWWVVHIWVEGVWELIMAAILAYLLIKMTGIDREIVEKWLYVIIGLALFTRPARDRASLLLDRHARLLAVARQCLRRARGAAVLRHGVWAFYLVYRGGRDHPNKAALLWSLGCPVMAFFGAGVWGFMHTLHAVNYYTHGTQVTAAHAHLAFYGAYVMVNLAIITYACRACAACSPTTRCSTCGASGS